MIWNRAAGQTAFGMVLGFGQYLVGGLLVLLVLQPLFGTNPLMAALIEVGFEGGHGTAAGMGATFSELGLPAGETLGLAMATVGVLTAVLLGSALVVIGRGRNWLVSGDPNAATGSTRQGLKSTDQDPISADERLNLERAAGTIQPESAPSMTIDSLTVNVALAGGAVGLGILFKASLTGLGACSVDPETAKLLQAIPVFPLTMVGGLIVQVILQRTRQTRLVSAVAQASVGSLAMDLLITAAMASLNLPLLEDNWIPFPGPGHRGIELERLRFPLAGAPYLPRSLVRTRHRRFRPGNRGDRHRTAAATHGRSMGTQQSHGSLFLQATPV